MGSYHIVSRLADRSAWFTDSEKEHFVRLLERFAAGYFVRIHAFCVMSNHFHLLVTGMEEDSKNASVPELFRRYRTIYGPRANPPIGTLHASGEIEADPDDGVERLRQRLGSVSRFVQELKQTFSRWYNIQHDRTGYLWGDRFKAVVTAKAGDSEVVQAAYIDLNPIRAKMVQRPEDYRWSSAGLKVRSPRRARRLLTPLNHPKLIRHGEAWYRMFVAYAGARPREGKRGRLAQSVVTELEARCGELGVRDRLHYRCRNLSEGVAVGTAEFIAAIQRGHGRKHIVPRRFLESIDAAATVATHTLFATRALRAPP